MKIDPIQYGGYGETRRGDAAQARADEAISDMGKWAGQLLDSKRSVNDAQQEAPRRNIQNTQITTQSPAFLTASAGATPRPSQPPAQLPGVNDSSKAGVFTWVPGKGLTWIEVPSSGENFVFTYQSEVADKFVFEEMLPCDGEEEP